MTALLALRGLAEPDRQRVLSLFRRQNPGPETRYAVDDLEIIATGNGHKPIATQFEDGAFIAAAGVLMYRGLMGTAAIGALLRDQISNHVEEDELAGAFAAVSWNGRTARFFTDWLGNTCAYCNDDRTVWSTSFLAAAASRRRHLLDRQGAWEYIFQGASCGESTVLAQIQRIDPEIWHDLLGGSPQARKNLLPRGAIEEVPFDTIVERTVCALNGIFDTIANEYGNRIDTALSGGYDSRLILAALRARGVMPRVHVYGNLGDPDVIIAKSIAAGEGFEIHHANKNTLTVSLNRDSLPEAIERNFIAFDGLPLDGIFDLGADLLTRQDRMKDECLALNGGGGEVFRNFFYLPDRRIPLSALLNTFYSRFDPRACADTFNANDYLSRVTQKVTAALKVDVQNVWRADIERVYPLFRCRYWMAHTTSINNQIGQAMTPLVHLPAVAEALRVPIRFKNYGRLEAAMIENLDSRLARYRSNYRSSMIGRPTLSEWMNDYTTLARPIWTRKLSYPLGRYLGSRQTCDAWMLEYGKCVPGDWSSVRELVIPERIRDVDHLRRAATLQFLCDRIGVEFNASSCETC